MRHLPVKRHDEYLLNAFFPHERTALFGSANFDLRSLFVNFEIGVIVYTRPEIVGIKAWIEDLTQTCSLPVQTKRSFLTSVAEDLCRLLAPIL